MLEIRSLSKTYESKLGPVPVLHDITLSIARGELCAITGVSGSGKTTLMNVIGLLDRAQAGGMWLDGVRTSALSPDQAARIRNEMIGFVFQSFHLLPRLTALDNAALPLLYRGLPRRQRRAQAACALERVGLANRLHHRPDELSGGQRQRVAVARALIGRPALLLADEPTGNLDSQSAESIIGLFRELNRELGVTVIIVTHDPTIAARCPRQIVLRDGRIDVDGRLRARAVADASP